MKIRVFIIAVVALIVGGENIATARGVSAKMPHGGAHSNTPCALDSALWGTSEKQWAEGVVAINTGLPLSAVQTMSTRDLLITLQSYNCRVVVVRGPSIWDWIPFVLLGFLFFVFFGGSALERWLSRSHIRKQKKE